MGRWTTAQLNQLEKLHGNNVSWPDLAQACGHPAASCKTKFYELRHARFKAGIGEEPPKRGRPPKPYTPPATQVAAPPPPLIPPTARACRLSRLQADVELRARIDLLGATGARSTGSATASSNSAPERRIRQLTTEQGREAMPFENLETVTKQNMPPMAKLSYMPPQGRGKSLGKIKNDPKPQLIVSIPSTICGTAKAKTFELLLGSGADAGKLRVKGSKTKDKGIEPKELMHAFIFRFGYVPKLGDDHFDGEHRPVRKISDDEFEIDIPKSWFEGA